MSLDIKEIYRKRNTEEDKGVSMGTEELDSRLHLGESHSSITHGDSKLHMNGDQVELKGTTISLNTPIENIILNGAFRFNPELMSGLPSTMVSPIPVLKPAFYAPFDTVLGLANSIKEVF